MDHSIAIPEASLYTLEEAARLTGRSPEALRKRFLRGQIEGVGSRESNDGKVRLRLSEAQIADLRVDEEEAEIAESPPVVESPDPALSRLVETLERQLIRAEAAADEARLGLATERTARDTERLQWSTRLDALAQNYEAQIALLRDERQRDRRAAGATVERLKRELEIIKEQTTKPAQKLGFFARILRLG